MANDGFQVGLIDQDGNFVPKGTFDYDPGSDDIVLREESSGDTIIYESTAGIWKVAPSMESDNNLYAGLTEQQVASNTGTTPSNLSGFLYGGRDGGGVEANLITASSGITDSPLFNGLRSRGSIDSPSVVQDGDRIVQYRGSAYGGDGNYHLIGDMRLQAGAPTGASNEIIPGEYRIRTRDSDDALVTRLLVKSDGMISVETGTFDHNRVDTASNLTTSGDGYYSVDSSGGAVTVTLASADAVDGREINIKRNGANSVTVDTEGTETVEDASTYDLTADNEAVTLIYNSSTTDWEVF